MLKHHDIGKIWLKIKSFLNLGCGRKQILDFCVCRAYPLCYLDFIICDVYALLNIWPVLCFSVHTDCEVHAEFNKNRWKYYLQLA